MSRSNVYLVSAKHHENDKSSYDNIGFEPSEQKVTYSANNGVDVQETIKTMPDKPYRGMGRDELLHFSSQPFWRRLRMICIAFVLIGWIALIITVVALVLVYPRCREPGSRTWWQNGAVYRIYVPSFKDSNNDGIGDLKGIESKLDYIKGQGYDIVSLSPFYSTDTSTASATMDDFREGDETAIIDHKAVGDKFGNITDFENLVARAHEKGMYVLLDFIPNHTGKSHPWFTSSATGTGNEVNYYTWKADTGTGPPNNWVSVYNGSAWSLNASRNEYYLHQFGPDTADLNLRSARVRKDLMDVLKFWLDKEVDGFNIRHAAYLAEDYDLSDEPTTTPNSDNYEDYDHIYTRDQEESYGFIDQFRDYIKSHNGTTTDKLVMVDTGDVLDVARLYSPCPSTGIQMPLNQGALKFKDVCDGSCIAQFVDGWIKQVPDGKWANWQMGDENTERIASRFDTSFFGAFACLTYLLPGTPLMYAGDEMGTLDRGTGASSAWSRDQPNRVVLPWVNMTSDEETFCDSCTAWTDVGAVNGQTYASQLIKDLVALRGENSFRIGEYHQALKDSSVFSFVREFDGETGYLVAVNFGAQEQTRDFTGSHDTIPSEGTVAFVHGGSYEVDGDADLTSLKISAFGAVVVSWDYVAKEL